jgi:hypothetical protein
MKTTGDKTPRKPNFDREGYQSNLDSLNGHALPNLKRVRAKPLKHGGARPGAGRKPSGNQPILLRLSAGTIRKLRQEAKRRKQHLSTTADESLLLGLSRAR